LLTGEDHSALVARFRNSPGRPQRVDNGLLIVKTSPDGRYRLITLTPTLPIDLSNALPYYVLILVAIAALCWLLAVNIASPLRTLAQTVDRFGRGELSVRVHSSRRDEIGDLARSFDAMAERIQTLLTAERRLLQDISHELRSPLARMSFAAELMRTAE